MDWDLEMPPWNPEELGREAQLSVASAAVGSSSGCFGLPDRSNDQAAASTTTTTTTTTAASPSGPPKRTRAPANGASCSVDGCTADLSKCREYHRRHKVCEAHSKTPVVVVRGQEQRFCQQCSRARLVLEFLYFICLFPKKKLRDALMGTTSVEGSPNQILQTQGDCSQIAKEVPFVGSEAPRVSTYPLVHPTAATESNWAGDVRRTEKRTPPQLVSHRNFSISYSFGGERKQLHIFQDGETGNKATQSQLNLCAVTPYEGRSSGSRMFDCALSLLSSATSDVNLSQMMPPSDKISTVQYGGFMQHTLSQVESDVRTPTGCSMGKSNEFNCHSKFQVEGEDCSDGNSQTLPSYWPWC
ncbi:Squamosa promoter-binding-like protein [Musa troglodytarum]|uniref:Squamosa promoter-binding-like protein n=1 Tax=Musa troglodytarum TaxID=320322 RepID=A0A9E7FM90_9LILI|nr:Squamosa promoter-binding-like protein [Musa troglodytarum]